jgi:hypothetical protein
MTYDLHKDTMCDGWNMGYEITHSGSYNMAASARTHAPKRQDAFLGRMNDIV